jgi:hypothetical protein
LALLGSLLAGCSSLPSMSMPAWFTSSGSNANASASASATLASLPADFDCPAVQVRTGASTLTSPAEPTPTSLRYQVTISTTARECRLGAAPNTITLKVGMQGRVIRGPEGTEVTAIDVPLRFAVVLEATDSKVISTKFERVPVALPTNDSNVLFTHVTEGLDFPIPRGNELAYYVIYIGFDPAGLQPEPRRPAPRKPRPSARPTG